MNLSEHISISKRSLRMMFHLSKAYTLCLISGALLKALAPYIPIYFSARLIDALFAGQPLPTLILYVLLTVGLTFLCSLLQSWIEAVQSHAWQAAYRANSWLYSEKSMKMAYASIESQDVRLLLERIKKESQTGFNHFYLQDCISRYVTNFMQIIASIGLSLAFFLLPAISFSMKIAFVAGIALTAGYGIFSSAKSTALDVAYMDSLVPINILAAKYEEYITDYSAGKDIRLYGMADMLAEHDAETELEFYTRTFQKNKKQAFIAMPQTVLRDLLKYGTYLILIFAALQGAIPVGSIAKYVSCLMLLLSAVSDLVLTVQLSFANHHYLKHYFSYFDIPNNMYQGSLTVEKRDDNEYYVEFKDVSFRYPNTETYALRHVNLQFCVGEKLAVVGMNGSGKTTFIKLLCRLYDPTEGTILLNGVDIRKYDYNEYLSIFSVVFQDFRLLALTLGQNVAAATDYAPDRVRECLFKAGFGQRLDTLPDGTETYLYQNFSRDGIEISGGEAQKIALARALYKDAPFIILDEPTAALDPVSEYEIYAAFNEIVEEKTAIYISHRLASCRFCDKVAVFDNGQLVQQGSHEELVTDTNGKYHELWYAQAQYYQTNSPAIPPHLPEAPPPASVPG